MTTIMALNTQQVKRMRIVAPRCYRFFLLAILFVFGILVIGLQQQMMKQGVTTTTLLAKDDTSSSSSSLLSTTTTTKIILHQPPPSPPRPPPPPPPRPPPPLRKSCVWNETLEDCYNLFSEHLFGDTHHNHTYYQNEDQEGEGEGRSSYTLSSSSWPTKWYFLGDSTMFRLVKQKDLEPLLQQLSSTIGGEEGSVRTMKQEKGINKKLSTYYGWPENYTLWKPPNITLQEGPVIFAQQPFRLDCSSCSNRMIRWTRQMNHNTTSTHPPITISSSTTTNTNTTTTTNVSDSQQEQKQQTRTTLLSSKALPSSSSPLVVDIEFLGVEYSRDVSFPTEFGPTSQETVAKYIGSQEEEWIRQFTISNDRKNDNNNNNYKKNNQAGVVPSSSPSDDDDDQQQHSPGRTVCIASVGLHDMKFENMTATEYVQRVSKYLSYLQEGCSHQHQSSQQQIKYDDVDESHSSQLAHHRPRRHRRPPPLLIWWGMNAVHGKPGNPQTNPRIVEWNEAMKEFLLSSSSTLSSSWLFMDVYPKSRKGKHDDNVHMNIVDYYDPLCRFITALMTGNEWQVE